MVEKTIHSLRIIYQRYPQILNSFTVMKSVDGWVPKKMFFVMALAALVNKCNIVPKEL